MQLFVSLFSIWVTVISGARLEGSYLPPSSAPSAGGSGAFLSAPPVTLFGGSSAFQARAFTSTGPANSYIPPPSGPVPASYSTSSSGQYGGFSSGQPQLRILRLDNQNLGDGAYRFEYETENQISQSETGELKNSGTEHQSSIVRGSYSYVSPDGQHITVNYIADENGFRPEGAHLPTPPPIPEAIRKSLEINASAGYPHRDESEDAYDGVVVNSRQYLAPRISQGGEGGYRY
ncbi:pupal cuticle protein 20-like [Cylas formicarius]|uniref:pupal cuticle protein 20-like n=1 Tax=Cylas formicarius TaxID=197179 RepID=UPI0029588D4A|nr:pupal cuticle protein 20-like [Cylas formicarius]